MTQLLTTNLSGTLYKSNYVSNVVDQVFRKADLLQWFSDEGLVVQSQGASPFLIPLAVTANSTPVVFAEGDAFSTVGSQGFDRASVPAFYTGGVAGYSGQVRDNSNKGGYVEDVLRFETAEAGAKDVLKKVDDTLCGGVANQGISSIIDDTALYGGIDPAADTAWLSYVKNQASASLSISAMQQMNEKLQTSPYDGNPSHILCAPNQISNYANTVGPGAGSSLSLFRIQSNGGSFDAGATARGQIAFNGIPLVKVAGLVTTEMYFLDREHIKLMVHRDISARPRSTTNDDDSMLITYGACIIVDKRKAHGKIKNITA